MDEPVEYNDVVYPSLEAMPPAVRAEYEAEEAADDEPDEDDQQAEGDDSDNDADDDSEGVTQPPAWSGARAGPTPPPEFAQVDLGPFIGVAEHQGLQLPSFGPAHVTLLAMYRDGLAYRASGPEVLTLRWEQMATVTSDVTYYPANTHAAGSIGHKYTLTTTNGESIILDDRLKYAGDAAYAIKQALFALLRPPALARYKAGEALTFGPLTVQKQAGLQLEGKRYPWDGIKEVQVLNGRLRVTLTSGKTHEARASQIPNLELLCQIIGVDFDSLSLAYR